MCTFVECLQHGRHHIVDLLQQVFPRRHLVVLQYSGAQCSYTCGMTLFSSRNGGRERSRFWWSSCAEQSLELSKKLLNEELLWKP